MKKHFTLPLNLRPGVISNQLAGVAGGMFVFLCGGDLTISKKRGKGKNCRRSTGEDGEGLVFSAKGQLSRADDSDCVCMCAICARLHMFASPF